MEIKYKYYKSSEITVLSPIKSVSTQKNPSQMMIYNPTEPVLPIENKENKCENEEHKIETGDKEEEEIETLVSFLKNGKNGVEEEINDILNSGHITKQRSSHLGFQKENEEYKELDGKMVFPQKRNSFGRKINMTGRVLIENKKFFM